MDPAEAVRSGAFVASAYSMYVADPKSLWPSKTGDFPAGYDLAAWVVMSDFVGHSSQRVFYGFIARPLDGTAPHVLALRGTEGFAEWWDDLHWGFVPFRVPGSGSIASGFATIYDTMLVVPKSASPQQSAGPATPAGSFADQVARVVAPSHAAAPPVPPAQPRIAVAGHSLGAALSTLYVVDNAAKKRVDALSLYTFASPRVGDRTFADAFNALGVTSWRVVNAPDVVPNFPPDIFGYVHVDAQYGIDSSSSTRPTLACAHTLNTYLHELQPEAVPLNLNCVP